MPFTLAHPFIVLPVARYARALPLSALVIGSMAPDLPYFIMLHSQLYWAAHSLRGIPRFDLLASVVLLFVFHGVLKMPLLALLPERQVERLYPIARTFRIRTLVDLLLTLLALLIGITSHLCLDSLTHGYGWGVRHIGLLRMTLGHGVHVYHLLQYGLSLLGLVILWQAYAHWLESAPAEPGAREALRPTFPFPRVRASTLCLLAFAFLLGIVYATARHGLEMHEPLKEEVKHLIEATLSAIDLSILLYAIWWHVARRPGPQPANEGAGR